LLVSLRVEEDESLRDEMLGAGAAELILQGCKKGRLGVAVCVQGLLALSVGDSPGTERIAAADGIDATLAIINEPGLQGPTVDLLTRMLQRVATMTPTTAEKVFSREAAICKALLVVLAGPARASGDLFGKTTAASPRLLLRCYRPYCREPENDAACASSRS
jgi:hypothetical protein